MNLLGCLKGSGCATIIPVEIKSTHSFGIFGDFSCELTSTGSVFTVTF